MTERIVAEEFSDPNFEARAVGDLSRPWRKLGARWLSVENAQSEEWKAPTPAEITVPPVQAIDVASGTISTLRDVLGSGVTFTQAAASGQAAFNAAVNPELSFAQFSAGATTPENKRYGSATAFNLDQPHTVAGWMTLGVLGYAGIFGKQISGTDRDILGVHASSPRVVYYRGSKQLDLDVGSVDAKFFVMKSLSADGNFISLRVNKVQAAPLDIRTSGVPAPGATTQVISLGAAIATGTSPFRGKLWDLMFFPGVNLLAPANRTQKWALRSLFTYSEKIHGISPFSA